MKANIGLEPIQSDEPPTKPPQQNKQPSVIEVKELLKDENKKQ